MTASAEIVLESQELCKSFRSDRRSVRALHNVSISVRRGRVTGLIGPDAAGKTTLMRLAAGLLLPDSGTLTVLGMDVITDALTVQASVGYMPQQFGLYEDLTVRENLDLYADMQGVPRAVRSQRYDELMHMTGLAPFMRRLAGRLSGGMKQKLGLACTLVRTPQLLLLDEPTVGVDPVSRRELWEIVNRFVDEAGTTVLLSTAYLDEAERCSEVAVLHEGELLDQDTPDAFKRRVEGRTYAVTVPGAYRRDVEAALADRPGVTDAVLHGDEVRLVMQAESRPQREFLLPEIEDAEIEETPPRFEDAFVALIAEQRTASPPGADSAGSRPSDADAKPPPSPPASGECVIEVSGLARRFGSFYAVKGISFDVRPGEIFGLLGANGAGKTTTFRMLCGLLPATAGRLRVAGLDMRKAAARARSRIGYMSQKFSLYRNLTVGQNLRFFSGAYGLTGRKRSGRIAAVMEQFSLTGLEDTTSDELPLGYKQRLALAAALMHEPDILFLDEPTSGVDPLARREFWRQINALAAEGVTVLVTTHFMQEADYCDRLGIMVAGDLPTVGPPAEIKQSVRTAENPRPTMEDAFIDVIERHQTENGAAA